MGRPSFQSTLTIPKQVYLRFLSIAILCLFLGGLSLLLLDDFRLRNIYGKVVAWVLNSLKLLQAVNSSLFPKKMIHDTEVEAGFTSSPL